MNARNVTIIAIAFVLLLFGYKLTKPVHPDAEISKLEPIDEMAEQTPQAPNDEAETTAAEQAASTLTTVIPTEEVMPAKAAAEKLPRPVAAMIPPTDKVKEEVKRDPHTTPRSIMAFSLELGDRFDKLKSEDEARDFMNELDTCVNDGKNVESAQTLCLVSARDVSKKFKSLDAAYSNLESRADVRVKKAAARMN